MLVSQFKCATAYLPSFIDSLGRQSLSIRCLVKDIINSRSAGTFGYICDRRFAIANQCFQPELFPGYSSLGLGVPAAAAQVWRSQSPVDSNRHSKEWKFIGVLAVALMALVTGFQFAPATFISDLFFPTAANPNGSLAGLQQLAFAALVFILMRLCAGLTLVLSRGKLSKAEAQDA